MPKQTTPSVTKLHHRYKWLWRENGLLDELARDDYGNLQPLSWYIKQLPKTSRELAKKHPIRSAYANYFGWQGEVLCEFWLRVFGGRYDLRGIWDTSANQYNRGFDLGARSVFWDGQPARIQVKMRGQGDAIFKEGDLYTFLDEAAKANVLPQNLFLMVPTATKLKHEVLSYFNEFQKRGLERFQVITGNTMMTDIDKLPLSGGRSGTEEFLTRFRESVLAADV